jgi:hypothetical protein
MAISPLKAQSRVGIVPMLFLSSKPMNHAEREVTRRVRELKMLLEER